MKTLAAYVRLPMTAMVNMASDRPPVALRRKFLTICGTREVRYRVAETMPIM